MKFDLVMNFAFKFAKEYWIEYFKAMLLPIGFGLVAALFVVLTLQNRNLFPLAILSIPMVCYVFWKGYVITYALNYASYFFYKKSQKGSFADCLGLADEKKQELAKYVSFCACIFIVALFPSLIVVFKIVKNLAMSMAPGFSEIIAYIPILLGNMLFFMIFLPFSNFLNQAFFFKKQDETYFDLFKNCYKKLNSTGIALAIAFSILGGIACNFHPVLSLFLSLGLNLITYSANTVWYVQRVGK